MKREYPWDKVPDVYGSAWSSARIEHEFGAFIVEVEYGVEVSVTKENFSIQLKMKFVSVAFHAAEKLWR
jgi:hypothetical protein